MSLAGADVSPFSEERHSLLQRHGHLLPLHLAADAVRDVLPRVPPQVVSTVRTVVGVDIYILST